MSQSVLVSAASTEKQDLDVTVSEVESGPSEEHSASMVSNCRGCGGCGGCGGCRHCGGCGGCGGCRFCR